jgi:WD40 repeat protein
MTRLGPRLEVRELASGRVRMLAVTRFPPGVAPSPTEYSVRTMELGDHRIGEVTHGPSTEIVELVASASGRRLLSLDDDKHVVFWDLDAGTGRQLASDGIHLAISPDGTRAVTSREGNILESWDLATAAPTLLARTLATTTLAIGLDNRIAAGTLDGDAYVFHDGEETRVLRTGAESGLRAAAFTPDGKRLVVSADDLALYVFDLASGAGRMLTGHSAVVTTLVMAPDNRHLAATGADPSIRIWDLADDSAVALRGHTELVTSINFEHDDLLVTASDDRTARIWDLRSGASRPLTGHADAVLFAAFLPGHSRVIAVDRARQVAEYPDDLPLDPAMLRAYLANTR